MRPAASRALTSAPAVDGRLERGDVAFGGGPVRTGIGGDSLAEGGTWEWTVGMAEKSDVARRAVNVSVLIFPGLSGKWGLKAQEKTLIAAVL